MRSTLVSGTVDILAGLAALVVFLLADGFIHVAADLRGAVLALSVLCLSAGLLRGNGRPVNAWLKGLLVASGGTLALIVLLWNQIHHAFLAILLLVMYLFTVCGVRARRLWSHQLAGKGAIILLARSQRLLFLLSQRFRPSPRESRRDAGCSPIPAKMVPMRRRAIA